jgi:hypothetical protein
MSAAAAAAVCVGLPGAGVPPTVLSFVHLPGQPHALPSVTHTDIASLWEEPCLAFVRLVVSRVSLGPAASAAATAVGEGGGCSSSSSRDRRKASKVVLKRLTGLLKGEPAAAEVRGFYVPPCQLCWCQHCSALRNAGCV